MYIGNFIGTTFKYTATSTTDNAIPGNKVFVINVNDMSLPISTNPTTLDAYYTLQDRGVIQYLHDHLLT